MVKTIPKSETMLLMGHSRMPQPRQVFLAGVTALLLTSRAAFSAGIPFSESFDLYDNAGHPSVVPTGFAEIGGWSVQDDGSGNDYRHANSDVNNTPSTLNASIYSATVILTNAVGTNFVMSAQMTINLATTTDSRNDIEEGIVCLGIGAFAPGYKGAVDLANTNIGRVSLRENGTVRASTVFPTALNAGTIYTLTMKGTYDGPSSLNLEFTMTDGVSTSSVSYVDSSPLTGQNFGFDSILTTYPGGTTASVDVDYDELSVLSGTPAASTLSEFGLTNSQFKFTVTGLPGSNYIVQVNTNLNTTNWVAVATNASPYTFTDSSMTNYPQRFFRAIYKP